jgi:hypothetical protein
MPSLACDAKKSAMVAGDAGIASRFILSHQLTKIVRSERYALRVDAAVDSVTKFRVSSLICCL